MTDILFDAEIIKIGNEANALLDEDMMVLFGSEAPELLQDVCFIHNYKNEEFKGEIKEDDVLLIGDNMYNVLSVGEVANDTFKSMGHCTIRFESSVPDNQLPGTICVEKKGKPIIKVGTRVKFVRL